MHRCVPERARSTKMACAFATWPGHIPSGLAINEPLHGVDWYPTLLKLVGASTEQPLAPDGMDIWPVLTAGAKSPHDLAGAQPESVKELRDRLNLFLMDAVKPGNPEPASASKSTKRGKRRLQNRSRLIVHLCPCLSPPNSAHHGGLTERIGLFQRSYVESGRVGIALDSCAPGQASTLCPD